MLIKVKVFPGSKKEGIVKKRSDSFDVKVREKPVRGEATRAVINVLSNFFDIPENKVKLIKGFKKRNKIFEIIL
jgi:uncharacterized protein YggU (UPF0235/DUF167 family)